MTIEILLFDGFDELDALVPFALLGAAVARRAPFEVALAGAHGRGEVRSRHGLRVLTGQALGHPHGLIVPGGGWADRPAAGVWAETQLPRLPRLLAAAAQTTRWIASVGSGAMLLAAAGLLRGRRATTGGDARDDLRAAAVTLVNDRVVADGDVITAATGVDLAQWLIERDAGLDIACATAAQV